MSKVLVTGATGGLGRVVVEKFLSEGFSVVGVSINNKSVVDTNRKYAESLGLEYLHINIDLTKSTIRLDDLLDVEHVILTHGVNFNANILELKPEIIHESMDVNYVSHFKLAQVAISYWLQNYKEKDNSITYISSVASQCTSPSEVAYHSAKRAMESAMRAFTREFTNETIRFNVISPGLMDTAMGKETVKNRPDVLDRIPLKMLIPVDEVAEMIIRCVKSKSLTGQNLQINAGRNIAI